MTCLSCARGFIDECMNDIQCGSESASVVDETNIAFIEKITGTLPVAGKKKGRPVKEDAEDIKDPFSTGRKRAAALYPLDRELPCEWRDYINCGGGKYPIAGCSNGLQENLHHGPDKNTLNNERHNIHKICAYCHNRWHAANDPEYDDTDRDTRHSPILYSSALELVTKFVTQQSKDK